MGPFLLLTNPLLLPPLLSVDFRMIDKGASLIIPTSPTELSSLHSWELSSREETQCCCQGLARMNLSQSSWK